MGKLYVVGIGPGREEYLCGRAREVCLRADVIIGYTTYIRLLQPYFPDKEYLGTSMRGEEKRCELAIEQALLGRNVALISGGDAGIYGMAGLVLELAEKRKNEGEESGSGEALEIEVVPGITAAVMAASILGAPLMNDFCVVSLSDLLTPAEVIRRRIRYAAEGDFVICLYNPRSHTRTKPLEDALSLLGEILPSETPVGIVRNAGREGQKSWITTLGGMEPETVDMFCVVLIGNSATRVINGKMITERGYRSEKEPRNDCKEGIAEKESHGGKVFQAAAILHTTPDRILDYSSNFNPFGCPESVREAIRGGIGDAGFYPDEFQTELRNAIGEMEGVPPQWIYAGAGAAELIFRICYGLHPAYGAVYDPSFLEYRRALLASGARVVRLNSRVGEKGVEWYEPEMGTAISRLSSGDVVFLCSPNNPTGLLLDQKMEEAFLDDCLRKGIYVVIDECFLNFTLQGEVLSMKRKLSDHPNLILLKSFTKMFAIPGIRIGYLMTSNLEVLDKIRNAGQGWNLSCCAYRAGIAASKEEAYAKQTAKRIAPLREELKKNLSAMDFEVFHGQANFLCFRAHGMEDLREKLFEEKILIRSCRGNGWLGAEDYRVAVRTQEENDRLIQALWKVTGGRKK